MLNTVCPGRPETGPQTDAEGPDPTQWGSCLAVPSAAVELLALILWWSPVLKVHQVFLSMFQI